MITDFGFFTQKGEKSAVKLIEGICTDIQNDSITRRMSMDRLLDTMETLGTFDEGSQDPSVISKVLERVNRAFMDAGYVKTNHSDYMKCAEKRRNSVLPNWSGLPVQIALVADTAGKISKVCSSLSHQGVRISFSDLPPWHDDYDAQDSHISVYVRMPQDNIVERGWSVGCIVLGEENSQYLDVIMALDNPEDGMKMLIPQLYVGKSIPLLHHVEKNIHELNLVLAEMSLSNAETMSRLSLECSDDGIVPTWDGITVSAEAGLARLEGRQPSQHTSMEGIVFTHEETTGFRI